MVALEAWCVGAGLFQGLCKENGSLKVYRVFRLLLQEFRGQGVGPCGVLSVVRVVC